MGAVKCGEESSCAFPGDDFHVLLARRTCFSSLLLLRLDLAILGGSLALKHPKGNWRVREIIENLFLSQNSCR